MEHPTADGQRAENGSGLSEVGVTVAATREVASMNEPTPPRPTSHATGPHDSLASEPGIRLPRDVRLAVILCLAVGVAGLLQALTAFLERRHLDAGLSKVSAYMNLDTAIYRTSDLSGSLKLAMALGICALVFLVPLGFFLSRGYQRARVATWVVGAALIVGEVVLIASDSSAVKTGEFVTEVDVPGGDPGIVAMLNGLLVQGWFPPLHYVTELLVLVGVIWLCIQLIRPASGEYFRREVETATHDDRVWNLKRPS
jgi:hypothetical protein